MDRSRTLLNGYTPYSEAYYDVDAFCHIESPLEWTATQEVNPSVTISVPDMSISLPYSPR